MNGFVISQKPHCQTTSTLVLCLRYVFKWILVTYFELELHIVNLFCNTSLYFCFVNVVKVYKEYDKINIILTFMVVITQKKYPRGRPVNVSCMGKRQPNAVPAEIEGRSIGWRLVERDSVLK